MARTNKTQGSNGSKPGTDLADDVLPSGAKRWMDIALGVTFPSALDSLHGAATWAAPLAAAAIFVLLRKLLSGGNRILTLVAKFMAGAAGAFALDKFVHWVMPNAEPWVVLLALCAPAILWAIVDSVCGDIQAMRKIKAVAKKVTTSILGS